MSAPKEISSKPKVVSRGHYGSPKKGGGGGKGTWGKGGLDDLYVPKMSPKDPGFDEIEDSKYVLEEIDYTQSVYNIEPILRDYFVSGDTDEAIINLKEKLKPEDYPNFVRKSMFYAMEQHGYEREIVSRLFVALSKIVTFEQFSAGFQQALDLLEDVILDSPDGVDLLGKFIARAIMDEVVPPAFLKNVTLENDKAKECFALANTLVNEPNRAAKLTHIWGPGDLSSVKRLKKEVSLLIDEFLNNEDLKELDLSIRNLNAPSFYFEIVKQTGRKFILKDCEKKMEESKKLWKLLQYLDSSKLVVREQITKGIALLVSNIRDIELDIPNASSSLVDMIERANNEGWVSTENAKFFMDRISSIKKKKNSNPKEETTKSS